MQTQTFEGRVEELLHGSLTRSDKPEADNLPINPDELDITSNLGGKTIEDLAQYVDDMIRTRNPYPDERARIMLACLAKSMSKKALDVGKAKLMDAEQDVAMAKDLLSQAMQICDELYIKIGDASKEQDELTNDLREYQAEREKQGVPIDVPAVRKIQNQINEIADIVSENEMALYDMTTKKEVLKGRLAKAERARDKAKLESVHSDTTYERDLFDALSSGADCSNYGELDPEIEEKLMDRIRTLKVTTGASFDDAKSLATPIVGAEGTDLSGTLEGKALQVISDIANLQRKAGPPPQLRADALLLFRNKMSLGLMDMNTRVSDNNPLIEEMKLLNLASLAGYNPIVVMRVFGVPISGVGKRLMDAWIKNGKKPLMLEDIRRVFRLKSYQPDTFLDVPSVAETLNSELLKDLNQQRSKSNKERGDKAPKGPTKVIQPTVGEGDVNESLPADDDAFDELMGDVIDDFDGDE